MKKLLCILPVILAASLLGEETAPEIQKIDARLDVLRTIWRQEQAIINGYTKNRTVPVKEGSAAHHACLKASQRIQQAEAEAKILKEKRALTIADPNKVTAVETVSPAIRSSITDPNNNGTAAVENGRADQDEEDLPSNPFGGGIDESWPKMTTLTSSVDVTAYVDRISNEKQKAKTVQDAFQKLTVSDVEAEMKNLLAKAEAGEIPLNVAESRMRDLAMKAIKSKQNTQVSVVKLKEMAQCDEFDVFRLFYDQYVNISQVNNENSGDPQAVAEVLMRRLDPRNFLNKLEDQSKTLNSINSKIEIKGKNLDVISNMLDSSQYLDLCIFLLKESGDEINDKSEVSVRHVFKAAHELADRLFYLHVAPGVHKDYENNLGHSRMPWVYSTESIELFGANSREFAGCGGEGGTSNNGWSRHPDGTGYIHDWRPRDGPIMLASFNNKYNQPLDPKKINRIANPKTDDRDEDSMDDKLKQKLELGEISEDQYNKILAQKPKDNLRYLITLLIAN